MAAPQYHHGSYNSFFNTDVHSFLVTSIKFLTSSDGLPTAYAQQESAAARKVLSIFFHLLNVVKLSLETLRSDLAIGPPRTISTFSKSPSFKI